MEPGVGQRVKATAWNQAQITVPSYLLVFATGALSAVGSQFDADGFRTARLAGAKTIPAYLSFLAAAYVLNIYFDHRIAIVGDLLVWPIVATTVFLLSRWL